MYSVTEQELDSFAGGYSSFSSVLFGIAAGGLITTVVTLNTAGVTDPITHADFFAGALVAGAATLFFGGNLVNDALKARRQVARIKTERRTQSSVRS